MITFRTICNGIVVAILAAPAALGLPPPWELEKAKAQRADLIVIGKIISVKAPKKGDPKGESQAVVAISEVLKSKPGTLILASDGSKTCQVLFTSSKPAPGGGGIKMMRDGPPIDSPIALGETALIFLSTIPNKPGQCRVVLGSFGYLKLETGKPDAITRSLQRIQRHHEWSLQVKEADLKKLLDGVYIKTIDFLNRPAPIKVSN
jgi:hypothetical protein